MKINIIKPVEIEAKFLKVRAGVRYPEDSEFIEAENDRKVNYISDDEENPKMPFMEAENDKYGHKKFYWTPTIDLENGVIVNWPKGVKVHVFYKVCDDFECTVYDEYDNEVLHYEGYVPDFMSIEEEGYGDYINMIIDENGCIQNWNITSSDIQSLMEDY